jgi:hypothetical protein
MRAEVDKALNMIERAVMAQIEGNAMRVTAFEAIKHLINDGNALCYPARSWRHEALPAGPLRGLP